jgi:hypothetical protein
MDTLHIDRIVGAFEVGCYMKRVSTRPEPEIPTFWLQGFSGAGEDCFVDYTVWKKGAPRQCVEVRSTQDVRVATGGAITKRVGLFFHDDYSFVERVGYLEPPAEQMRVLVLGLLRIGVPIPVLVEHLGVTISSHDRLEAVLAMPEKLRPPEEAT